MTQNKIIGLTGGSGCGKTTVANILKNLGAFIIDADFIAHNVIKKGKPAYFEILDFFGNDILSLQQEIDRKKLSFKVFSSDTNLDILNNITHKYILKQIFKEIDFAKSHNFNIIVLDAPLLIETNLHNFVDEVWVVFANRQTQINRLIKRDLLSKKQIEARLSKQTPFEQIKKFADFIIYNDDGTDLNKIILNKLKGY